MLKLGLLACAVGKHKIGANAVKRIHGQNVGRCHCCGVPLEEEFPGHWITQAVHDAGLGPRLR